MKTRIIYGIILTLVLVSMLTLTFDIQPIKASNDDPSILGVKPGHWVEYEITSYYYTNDTNPPKYPGDPTEMVSSKIRVLEVNGTEIKFEEIYRFKNGTEISENKSMDLSECTQTAIWFILPNLDAEDTVFQCSTSPIVSGVQSRRYWSNYREVNIVNQHIKYSTAPNHEVDQTTDLYYEKSKGVLFEIHAQTYIFEVTEGYETQILFWLIVDETNIWDIDKITIKSDGSIDPPTAPITIVNNVTYILADDVNASIIVQRNSIVIDGNEHTLQGPGVENMINIKKYYTGIYLSNVTNVKIKNMVITGFKYGVWVERSNDCKISENEIKKNRFYAIYLNYSSNNVIDRNNITSNIEYGVYGIQLYESDNNIITRNSITNNGCGIYFRKSFDNTASGNQITNNSYGVRLSHSSRNQIYENLIKANSGMGIEIVWSPSNRIYENSIEGNGDGIWVQQSDNNVIFHNNFINNTHHAYEYPYTTNPSFNEWDNGYPLGGNYWSDYNGTDLYSGQHQNVTGSDGIGDIPYVTFTNNTDNYPLMNPYTDDPILLMAMENLQKQVTALRDEVTAVRDALNSTERLLYVSLITTIIFIATTIYFARDKWKKRLKSRAQYTSL